MSHAGSWVSSNFAVLLKNRKKIHQSCAQNYRLGSRGLLARFSDSKVSGKRELAAMTVQGWSTPLVPRVAQTLNQHVDSWDY